MASVRSSKPMSAPKDPQHVVPIGQTTTLSADDLNRIKTTLMHAEATSIGQTIATEVRPCSPLPTHLSTL